MARARGNDEKHSVTKTRQGNRDEGRVKSSQEVDAPPDWESALTPPLQLRSTFHPPEQPQLGLRLALAELARDAALAALDHLCLGVVLVDEQNRVCFANHSAASQLDRRDGLLVRADAQLVAALPEETRALHGLVLSCANGHDQPVRSMGGAVSVSRPSGQRPLEVVVSALRGEPILPGLRQPVAAVFVSDPEGEPEGSVAALERLYNLTPSEARVAVAVAGGQGLQQAADSLNLGLNTVRTHLQHVFQKTGTRRQAELVQLLLRGPLQLRLG
jgi:DNA-binding CsgD family transcriptional regulator